MKRGIALFVLFGLLLLPILGAPAAQAQTETGNVIVRDNLPLAGTVLQTLCNTLGLLGPVCNVLEGIDGPINGTTTSVFLLQPLGISVAQLISDLQGVLGLLDGVVDAEPDFLLNVEGLSAPPGLSDTTPVNYYGTSVWQGYANQPAATIINLQQIQSQEGTGKGAVVAVIDTGVDPNQPVLQGVLLTGYDFTRNKAGGSELPDVSEKMDGNTGASPAEVQLWAVGVLDPYRVSVFEQPKYEAFGHGTMVSGIVHLVAPSAQIMPLKAFGAKGTGKLSDVLRAIYYATQNNANILNMSFDFPKYSTELDKALTYTDQQSVVSVSAMGNKGEQMDTCEKNESPVACPAGASLGSDSVMGIASTSNDNTLSSFSNYGAPPTWLGAPGEAIISPYPYNTYAAGWGTSFSTPFVSGTVALMRGVSSNLNQHEAALALENADNTGDSRLGYGILDAYQAVMAWCRASGKC